VRISTTLGVWYGHLQKPDRLLAGVDPVLDAVATEAGIKPDATKTVAETGEITSTAAE
jgi:hypothetical protein